MHRGGIDDVTRAMAGVSQNKDIAMSKYSKETYMPASLRPLSLGRFSIVLRALPNLSVHLVVV